MLIPWNKWLECLYVGSLRLQLTPKARGHLRIVDEAMGLIVHIWICDINCISVIFQKLWRFLVF